jgi:isopenicillin N synthase-like dioxygenase
VDVPLIDCHSGRRSEQAIAAEIDRALGEVGFMALTHLGVSERSVRRIFAVAAEFFAGPEERKRRCAYAAASENFGYQGVGEEKLDPRRPADLKETFTMRNLLAAPVGEERWPDSAFRDAVSAFYREAMGAAQRLQRLLAQALGVADDFFVTCHGGENITLRLLHYPATSVDRVAREQMGAGAHTDYGMLTLLWQDAVGGLQVQAADGTWHDVPHRPGAVVINAGDLLERWSNGRYRSTVHRVLPREPGQERFSVALFIDPDSATRVEALPSCVAEGESPRYPPTTAGEHLQEKIMATHLA